MEQSSLFVLVVSYNGNKVLWIEAQVPCSQHSIFFVTYKSAQKAKLFHNTKLERLTIDKHSNLFGQFLSYEENEVLWIRTLETRLLKHFITFLKSIQSFLIEWWLYSNVSWFRQLQTFSSIIHFLFILFWFSLSVYNNHNFTMSILFAVSKGFIFKKLF
jgi:hypothetical protein